MSARPVAPSRYLPGVGLTADRVRVAAWAAVVLLLVGARSVGFTTDSDAYLDVAANLRAGRGLVQLAVDFWRPGVPDPLGMWPPLYPLAVAALSALGIALPLAARLVSGAAFVAFALAFHGLALRVGGRPFAFVAALLALLTPALAVAGSSAWSESLYLALATWALVGAYDLALFPPGGAPPARRALLAGLALGLAADARYLALALVSVVLALLLAARISPRAVAAWAIGLALPVVPWLVRGLVVFGRPFGPALPTRAVALGGVLHTLVTSARWDLLPHPVSIVAGAVGLAFLGVGTAWWWAVRKPGAARWAAWVAVAQLGAVGAASARLGVNDAAGRYTVVAWPFVVLVTAAGARAALARLPGGPSRARVAQATAAALGLGLYGAGLGWFLATNPAPAPAALARAREEAALTRLVGAGTGPVLSDRGQLLRLATGRAAVQVPPARFRLREFTADDERRWVGLGVNSAVLAAGRRDDLGAWLAARTAGGVGAWAVEDSGDGLVRYRIGP